MARFCDSRVEAIYDFVLNHCDYFPKLTEINEAIRATAHDEKELEFPLEEPVTCQRCLCEGIVCEITDPNGKPIREVPYRHVSWKLKRGEYSSIRRCTCANGNEWPRKWPRIDL